MPENEYKSLFISEAREHIVEIFSSLGKIEKGSSGVDDSVLFDIFRRFHTLKGMANTMGALRIGELAHSLEDLLESIRKSPELIFSTKEFIRRGLGAISNEIDNYEHNSPSGSEEILRELEYIAEDTKKKRTDDQTQKRSTPTVNIDLKGSYELIFEPLPECKTPSVRAFMLFRELSTRFRLITTDPTIQDLKTGVRLTRIKVYIAEEPATETINEIIGRVGEIRLLSSQPYIQQETKDRKSELIKYIRVPFERVEEISESLDELVLLWNKYRYSILSENESPMITRIDYTFKKLINYAGRLRTIPASSIIPKLSSIVDSTSRTLNKKVRLSVINDSIEIDKGIMDRLEEPLMHLIRNCIHHGVEMPDERIAKGKSETGNVEIVFSEREEFIEIKVRDDGRGIDIERIAEVALERGVVKSDEKGNLKEKDIIEFIFIPGFSTLRSADMTSGRGVGMDVVRNVVWQLGGDINISTLKDEGTEFCISIPYQFAMKRVLICSIGSFNYAFSLNAIRAVVGRGGIEYSDDRMSIIREREEFRILNYKYDSPQMYLLFSLENGGLAVGVDDILFVGEARLYKSPYVLKSGKFVNGMVITNGICPVPIISIESLRDERNI